MIAHLSLQNGSSFHGNAEPLYLFVSAQFRTKNRFTLFLELLQSMMPKSVKRFLDDIMLYLFDLEPDSDFRSIRA
ncbi:hypothetical protein [Mesorhizobium sanjuanii]|uniref:hypothetical protein n=1 Tax=Mesorhizobium sanjuanii TaxID=2037900 RepID=UPI001AD83A2E|nr:hypothetical protein [Mesorhizobium sanjuanii]